MLRPDRHQVAKLHHDGAKRATRLGQLQRYLFPRAGHITSKRLGLTTGHLNFAGVNLVEAHLHIQIRRGLALEGNLVVEKFAEVQEVADQAGVEEARSPQVYIAAGRAVVFHTVAVKTALDLVEVMQLAAVHTDSERIVFESEGVIEVVVVDHIGFGRSEFALAGERWVVMDGYIGSVRIASVLAAQTVAVSCLVVSKYWDYNHSVCVLWQFGHYRIRVLIVEKSRTSCCAGWRSLDEQTEVVLKVVAASSEAGTGQQYWWMGIVLTVMLNCVIQTASVICLEK